MRFSLSSLPARGRARLVGVLASYLARPVPRPRQSNGEDVEGLSRTLQHGDVLLTDGNTRAAAMVRFLTGSAWAHVAMYVGPLEDGPDPRCVVEADVAKGVHAIRLSELKGLQVRILRPTALAEADRRRLADWTVTHIGAQYDLAHAWSLAKRLLRLPSRVARRSAVVQNARRFICSSLLAQAFLLVGHQIVPAGAGPGDARVEHRDLTPRDFERASGFEVVGAARPELSRQMQ